MNLYQCQVKAQDIGFDKAKFIATFPAGPVECQWIDAHMGLLRIDLDGLRDNFVMVHQIDEAFPDLVVTEPFVSEQPEPPEAA